MPNFFSAFTSEVFRPLVTLLIPGAIGLSTWFIGLLWCFPLLKKLVSDNHTESSLLTLLAMIFAGLVFEDFGSWWESQMDKRADSKTSGRHNKEWFDYLRSAFVSDPIGRRYLRTLVMRLKFELGVAYSMISAAFGLIWLVWLGVSCRTAIPFWVIAAGFSTWGLLEASQTHKALALTRSELLKDIRIVK